MNGTLAHRRQALLCAGATALVAASIHALVPQPGDAAAHLYRTFLVRHGVVIWDNLWFAGQYPLASYSLLYYLPASAVGNIPLVFAASVASTLLFASIASREWGDAARWPIRTFGVLAAAPLFTGLYAYALGFTTMLAALCALQRRRVGLALLAAALTLGFSPLAFVFLCLVLVALVVSRAPQWRRVALIGTGLAAIAGVQLVAMIAFPTPGRYPFHWVAFAALEGVSLLGILVARRAPAARPLEALFALWGAGAVVLFVLPTPLGDNWARLSAFLLPLMLLTAALARFRPRGLVTLALAGAFAFNLMPYFLLIPYRMDVRPESKAFWTPAFDYLDAHLRVGYRVEVVPTAAHWESYWFPREGFALARGFYDQIDAADDAAVYAPHVRAAPYVSWLHSLAVAYVLLPHTQLDRAGGQGESRLLRSGAVRLPVVYRDRTWTIYAVPHPSALATGPGTIRIEQLSHTAITGRASAPGRYLLRVRYTPYATVTNGCAAPGPHGMTWLDLRRTGTFRVHAVESMTGLITGRASDCDGASAR